MKQRNMLFALLVGGLFLTNMAGASWLALTGSDSVPFQQSFAAQCAKPQISLKFDKTGNKVVEVVLTGDFSNCLGAQVLVTTYKTGKVYSYGVKTVTSSSSSISFDFEKQGGLGDFRQKFPLVVDHLLVPQGPLAPPTGSLDISQMEVVFAWEWQ
jgi:hypothetical protein